MKRVVFAAALLILLIWFNIFCLGTVSEIKNEITGRLDFLDYAIKSKDAEKTASECEKFTEFWLEKHHVLCRIVRHELLDQATMTVSRLVPLAEYEEYGELSAEISRCKILIEEIWDSEIPFLRNIF